MRIKLIRIDQLQAYCDFWEHGSGDEVRGLYLSYAEGLYIGVDSSRKVKSDPYWQEEFASFYGVLQWLIDN